MAAHTTEPRYFLKELLKLFALGSVSSFDLKTLCSASISRLLLVAAMLLPWLVLSNHCALAEMLAVKTVPASTEEHGCCNHHPAPAKDEKPCPPIQQGCCKSLTVIVPDGAKLPIAASLEVTALPVEWLVVLALALPAEISTAPETGPPPDVPGFAELVLHRSLRSHAPPLAA